MTAQWPDLSPAGHHSRCLRAVGFSARAYANVESMVRAWYGMCYKRRMISYAQWQVLGEITAGDMWVAVAEHPGVDHIDRTHCDSRTTLGFWMSPQPNSSRGRFLTKEWHCGDVPLGSIVTVPAGFPLRVRSEAMPARRMLHCRLPSRVSFELEPSLLNGCTDFHNDAIFSSLAQLAREAISPGFCSNALVEGLGLVIGAELGRAMSLRQPHRHRKGGLSPWQLRRIDDYLQSGQWNSSISEIAELCGISAGHAARAFRQSTGRSIATHIAMLRIERACTLLTDSSHSIRDIAASLRFANASAFAAAFRRVLGMNPNSYRQQRRSGH